MPSFCSLLILVVLQREILQQQRPADLYAHYSRADALLPCQWDHQRGMAKRDTSLTPIFTKLTFVENVCWNHFVCLAEIQRGSDVAERRWLLLVWHPRDGPRPQHHQVEGMCFLLDGMDYQYRFHFIINFLQWHHDHLYGLCFTSVGKLSSGG